MARIRSAMSAGDDLTRSVVMLGDVTASVVYERYSRGSVRTSAAPTRMPMAIGVISHQRRRLRTDR